MEPKAVADDVKVEQDTVPEVIVTSPLRSVTNIMMSPVKRKYSGRQVMFVLFVLTSPHIHCTNCLFVLLVFHRQEMSR